jgi:hypothetical protein
LPLSQPKDCGLDGKWVKRTGSEPNWFQEKKTHALVARIQTTLYQRVRKENAYRRLLNGKVMVYSSVSSSVSWPKINHPPFGVPLWELGTYHSKEVDRDLTRDLTAAHRRANCFEFPVELCGQM